MPRIMFKVMMNPLPYQKRKWMMQKQRRLNSLLRSPPGMVWQGAKTLEVFSKLGGVTRMLVSYMDRGVYRGMTGLEN
jgi:hypothetical protein